LVPWYFIAGQVLQSNEKLCHICDKQQQKEAGVEAVQDILFSRIYTGPDKDDAQDQSGIIIYIYTGETGRGDYG
jgi:hypothetical protein